MNNIPAHKQTDSTKVPGQIVNQEVGLRANETTLAHYIERKQKVYSPKLSFVEWFAQYNEKHGLPPAYIIAKDAWEAAQENK